MTKYIDRYYLNGELYGIKFAEGGGGRQPGANTLCWYKFDGDYSDATGNYGDATGTSTFDTLTSGQKVLQTDGSNLVLLPSGVTQNAITTYTVTFWMKTLTTSPSYGYYLGDQDSTDNGMSFYESTSGRNYYEWSGGNTSSTNNRDITPTGLTIGWRLVTIRSNGTSRSDVSLTINATNTVSSGGTSGLDSSRIFGYGRNLAIGGRGPELSGTGQITSIQISNLVISTDCWTDARVQDMYDQTKSLYGIS